MRSTQRKLPRPRRVYGCGDERMEEEVRSGSVLDFPECLIDVLPVEGTAAEGLSAGGSAIDGTDLACVSEETSGDSADGA